MEQLQRELREVKRELAAARRVLQDQQAARGRPIGPEGTVRALSDLQRDRKCLAEELRQTQASLRTQKAWYPQLRWNVWRLARAASTGPAGPLTLSKTS